MGENVPAEQREPASDTAVHVEHELILAEEAGGFVVEKLQARRAIDSLIIGKRVRRVDIARSIFVHAASVGVVYRQRCVFGELPLYAERGLEHIGRPQGGIDLVGLIVGLSLELADAGNVRIEELRILQHVLGLIRSVVENGIQNVVGRKAVVEYAKTAADYGLGAAGLGGRAGRP